MLVASQAKTSSPPQTAHTPLRLLVIDAHAKNAQHIATTLLTSEQVSQWGYVQHASEFRHALQTQIWDGILCRQGQTGLSPLSCLKILHELNLDLPFIAILDSLDHKLVSRLLRAGAHDCFAQEALERLTFSVEREVRNARQRADHRAALEMLKESEARFRALAANLPGMVFQMQFETAPFETDKSLRFIYVSEGCQSLFGLKPHELMSQPQRFLEAIDTEDRISLLRALDKSAAAFTTLNWEGRIRNRGQNKWINLRSTPQHLGLGALQWQGIATDITRSKETETQLRHSRSQLSELSDHMESAKEEERERIARDIHDELGSTLVAVKIETRLLHTKLPGEPSGLREKALSIEGLIDRAMSTVSRVTRELRPGILKEFGLAAAIECQAEDFNQRTGIDCRVRCDEDCIELDEPTSLALFRIVQEALTNVAKHAHASLVVVRLRREEQTTVLEIRDNGRGISELDMNKPKSFGLRGIRERISSLNGEFNISPAEQGGSHITLRIPDVRQPHNEHASNEEAQRELF